MRSFVTNLIIVVAGLLVVYVGFLTSKQTIQPLEPIPADYQTINTADAVAEFSTTTAHGFEIDVKYPVPAADTVREVIEKNIVLPVSDQIKKYEEYAIRCSDTSRRNADEEFPCPFDNIVTPWQLNITYTTYEGESTIAYLFNVYEYSGGAHGNNLYRAFSFSKDSGAEIEFRDLVSPSEEAGFMSALDRTTRDYFAKQSYGDIEFDLGRTLPETGVATFATDDGVGVAFSSYSLGSYALGTPIVIVPYSIF